MSKWLKVSFIILLHIATGYLFGRICIQVNSAYKLIDLPFEEGLKLLIYFVLSVGASLIAAGLVAVLIRPLWVGILSFILSGIALLLGWQGSIETYLLILIYVLAGTIYMSGVARDIHERIRFSLRSVNVGQALLSISLALVASGSLYLGYKEHIRQAGFSLPEPFMDLFLDQIESQFDMDEFGEESTETLTELKEELQQRVEDTIYQRLEPYEEFIPLGVAAGVFMPLVTLLSFLSLLPNTILGFLFSFLKAVGVVRVIHKTQEVQSLVLD
jgi:hypothetical protein